MSLREDDRRKLMARTFLASERGIWKSDPKNFPPFYEDVYGVGIPPSAREEAIEKVLACIRRFVDSGLFRDLADLQSKGRITWHRLDCDKRLPFDLKGARASRFQTPQ